jgi:predicted AAA+ superfamily ATPase
MRQRYLQAQVSEDLARKMVFVGGPRQVGKTTLAKVLLPSPDSYLNWDVPRDRERILRRELPTGPMWAFDELHKFRGWRNYLKGLYDGRSEGQRILVTGSARLDFYRFGGDSLQGRYHYLRLHPFSLKELGGDPRESMKALLTLSGFPEPLLGGSARQARRWSAEYRSRLVREDIGSLERLTDLGRLELLMLSLPERVGSPLSINALREDLGVSHATVAHWLEVFERTYAIFRLPPFGAPKLRAVKKEQKHYHFDWSLVPSPGARFENLVAAHLLKWVHFQVDTEGRELELRYFRDVDGREVDFVVTERRKPLLAVECKLSEQGVSQDLRYFKAKFPAVEAWQISLEGQRDAQTPEGIRLAPADRLLLGLV